MDHQKRFEPPSVTAEGMELIGVSVGARTQAQPPRRRRFDGWTVACFAVAGAVAAPLLAVILLALAPSHGIWIHLVSTVLPHYVTTTLALIVGVGLGTLVVGTGCAWLVTLCRFPGRRVFEWALLLPLAVPSYVVAYVYTDLLDYSGPLQILLREIFGWASPRDYWFPEIRSLGGAMAVMTLVLYPYVYLLARAAFLEQSTCVLEVSRTLGKGPWQSFLRIALPLARPALVVGVGLVAMECLNDFGTVDYFAVATLTAGVYDVWTNMNSTAGAAQLATVMLVFVLALVGLERAARGGRRFHHTSTRYRPLPGHRLKGLRGALAAIICGTPIALGFAIPALVLARYAVINYASSFDDGYLRTVWNSLSLSLGSALLATMVGVLLAYGLRQNRSAPLHAATRLASVGYAVPGAVLAVGIIVPLAALDNRLDSLLRETVGLSSGLLLSGTVFAVGFGYLVRFLALAFGTVESGLTRITPNMDGAARTLGLGPGGTLRRIHLPLMRGSLLTATLLVFVDSMKELPITMLIRPFNFDTLATYVHQLASDELLEKSALGALTIVVVGILPVILLSRTIARSRPGYRQTQGAAT